MSPTICRQCGGPIFYDARQCENPNICQACAQESLAPDFTSENVVYLTPWFEAHQKDGVIDHPVFARCPGKSPWPANDDSITRLFETQGDLHSAASEKGD